MLYNYNNIKNINDKLSKKKKKCFNGQMFAKTNYSGFFFFFDSSFHVVVMEDYADRGCRKIVYEKG